MAASDRGNSRRQRRRQLKQQPGKQRQETVRIPTEQSGLSNPRRSKEGITPALSRRLPTIGQRQLPNRDGLDWWQQIFGQTSRRPTSPTRRAQKNKPAASDNISQLPLRQTTEIGGFNLADLRAARLRTRSTEYPPFSTIQGSRSIREISPAKRRGADTNDANRRVPQQKLVPLAPPSRRDSPPRPKAIEGGQARKGKNVLSAQEQKKKKSRNTPSGSPGSIPRSSKNSVSRKSLPNVRASSASPLVYGSRLLILGIGLSVVVGTILSIWDPASRKPPGSSGTAHSSQPHTTSVAGINLKPTSTVEDNLKAPKLSQEIAPLKRAVASLATQYPQLSPGIFLMDIDTGAYLDWNGVSSLAAASTIKVPILIAFFQDVDAGKIRLDEQLTVEKEEVGSGSGKMQYKPVGTKYTALETATQMIITSDNTATNMVIKRLGGSEVLNQRFREWELTATAIRNKLPDIEGTNTTSAKELATLMARINQGELVSLASRDRIFDIMRRTQNRSLLPRGLGQGATIAHKTGNIGSILADVGLIDLPSGKRYIASVIVKRPRNDLKAAELIEKVSRVVYQYFTTPKGSPKLPIEDSAIPANTILSPSRPIDRSQQPHS